MKSLFHISVIAATLVIGVSAPSEANDAVSCDRWMPPKVSAYGQMVGLERCIMQAREVTDQSSSQAQSETKPESVPQLRLAVSMMNPDEQVTFPLYLNGVELVQGISIEIDFPGRLLEFVKAEKGILLDRAGINLKSEVRPDTSGQGDSTLLIDVQNDGAATQGIKDGLFLYVTFYLKGHAELGSTIPLKGRAKVKTLRDQNTIGMAAQFTEAVIPVSPRTKEDAILFACFFYMH